ncbi:MAG: protein-glutamate O-methyltransferase CheR [Flavobacterium sp.]|nr:protein-glutamate O-methyltransferase CheR [Flavobacterium sp.]
MRLTDQQLEVLIDEIHENYGYDFSGYAKASLKRRIERLITIDKSSYEGMISKMRNDSGYLRRIIEEITVNVTEMFRDPGFYKVVRTDILPLLATKPFIRFWFAGCSTGEEVYSFAIMLKEENLLHKSLIYATDLSPQVLTQAKKGVYPLRLMSQFAADYREAGGQRDFSEFYTANYGFAKFSGELSQNMVFSQHNLVSDGSFNEFNMIVCRNVMIYFDSVLQVRVLQLFDESLASLGVLALGSKETIKFSPISKNYEQWVTEKIWRKMR